MLSLPDFLSIPPFVSTAHAAVAGITQAMDTIVTLIVALAGIAVIGAIAWRGVQFLMARDYQHIMEGVIGIGVGGGLIAGCRPLGAAITGAVAASPLAPLVVASVSAEVGDLLGGAVFWSLTLTPAVRGWLWLRRG